MVPHLGAQGLPRRDLGRPAFGDLCPADGSQPGGDQPVGLVGGLVAGFPHFCGVLDKEGNDRRAYHRIDSDRVTEPLRHKPQNAAQQGAARLEEIGGTGLDCGPRSPRGQRRFPRQVRPPVPGSYGKSVEFQLQVPHLGGQS
ncbi:MAG: hypothetical protein ACLP3Q_14190 [Streptosporangiaceae bacterium]